MLALEGENSLNVPEEVAAAARVTQVERRTEATGLGAEATKDRPFARWRF